MPLPDPGVPSGLQVAVTSPGHAHPRVDAGSRRGRGGATGEERSLGVIFFFWLRGLFFWEQEGRTVNVRGLKRGAGGWGGELAGECDRKTIFFVGSSWTAH